MAVSRKCPTKTLCRPVIMSQAGRTRLGTTLTSPDLIEAGQHPDHEAGGDRDGVPGLLQHHLVPPHHHLRLLPVEGGLLRGGTPELDIVVNT